MYLGKLMILKDVKTLGIHDCRLCDFVHICGV
jgi:hypothetical protein